MRKRRIAAVTVAVVCAVAGILGLATADRGIERRTAVIDGVPVEAVRPAHPEGRLPGVVVAHGMGAGRRLMRGFADTLARRGYAVALVDLAGHGAATRPLPGGGEGPAANARLDRDLDIAVRRLRSMPWVDTARLGLVGHSMGAAAVIRYATARPSVGATVAISQGRMDVSASAPRNLLLIAGGLEFAAYRDGAVGALRAAYPRGRAGVTYGDPRSGTARRAVIAGGVEHAGVLFSPRTHRETAAWFDAAFGRRPVPGTEARAVQRAGSAMLLYVAAVLSFGAIASALLGTGDRAARRVSLRRALAGSAVAVIAAVPAMSLLTLPVAVTGPLAAFFGAIGLVTLASARGIPAGRPAPRTVAAAAALSALTAVSVAVPAHLGWAHAIPVGPRAWVLVLVTVCAALYCLGVEALCTGQDGRTAIGIHAWTAAGALAGLCAAVAVGVVSSYVLLLAPLIAGLLAWQGVQAAALRRLAAPAWAAAAAGGPLLAWPLAITMPIS
ncbi:alpha/beta fold hydrolase [Actinomadura madurae]|uniref:dienelactone hydrolase family protein n=1 Tax=Actinomadura madurae TaxID=1993 RepID=UPI0020272572|nr:alpha/beta fold hydrolase [Actinomadura madurae]URM95961.1 alpha/beta fold hydrolase [Actinomadura madurae]